MFKWYTERKLLPGVGAVVGGGLDLVETKIIADRAYKWFMQGDFSVKDEKEDGEIEIEDIDFENTAEKQEAGKLE